MPILALFLFELFLILGGGFSELDFWEPDLCEVFLLPTERVSLEQGSFSISSNRQELSLQSGAGAGVAAAAEDELVLATGTMDSL